MLCGLASGDWLVPAEKLVSFHRNSPIVTNTIIIKENCQALMAIFFGISERKGIINHAKKTPVCKLRIGFAVTCVADSERDWKAKKIPSPLGLCPKARLPTEITFHSSESKLKMKCSPSYLFYLAGTVPGMRWRISCDSCDVQQNQIAECRYVVAFRIVKIASGFQFFNKTHRHGTCKTSLTMNRHEIMVAITPL